MTPRIWVAIDESDRAAVDRLLSAIEPHREVKVGLELFSRLGPHFVRELSNRGYDLFLDLKYHDIPRTVGRAVAAVRDLGARMVTVHAAGGLAMLKAAVGAAGPMTVVAVTVLTSLDGTALREMGLTLGPQDWASELANLAREAGVQGIVCSGDEVAAMRSLWPSARVVVPGIRLLGQDAGDQRRVVTPTVAVQRGATDLVVGRAVTGASNPRAVLTRIQEDIAGQGGNGHHDHS
jgi:orotidine-5'-phosphate decarboxylase